MNQQLKYNVDIVLCIDATGSMSPVINDVKENALKFYEDLGRNMSAKGKAIDTLRIKVIMYRDFYVDGGNSFKKSNFFLLPDQSTLFSSFVNEIFADGGGDEPENGLEALAEAINSDWNKDGDKKRQIIVIWTDASAHQLERSMSMVIPEISNYPKGISKNLNDLTDVWEDQHPMSASGKRLIIYSPDSYPWTDIANHWTNTIHFASQAGHGLSDVEYNAVIDAIANSI